MRALKQARRGMRDQMRIRSDSVYSTSITAMTAGWKDKYMSIAGRQPYIVQ
jgi:ribonuclease HI